MTGLACLACGRTEPCPDCRHHNRIPGWDEPMLPLEENEEEGRRPPGQETKP